MLGDQILQREEQETLLFAIQDRLERRERPVLHPTEAASLLRWALSSADEAERIELLNLFRRLGGLEMVEAAMSDFD